MTESSRPNWARRVQAATHSLSDRQLDALVVSNPLNVRYLSGFRGSTAWLVLTREGARIVTDGRYAAVVRRGIDAGGDLVTMGLDVVESTYDRTLADVLSRSSARRVGFEASTVTVAGLRRWHDLMPGVDWEPTEDLVENLRLVKDDAEQAVLRRAGRMLDHVARSLGSIVAGGRAERDIARTIDSALERVGFERPAFETIVASGPNSAYPHARPTDRRLATGDLVVLDFGGVLDGYCVDLTRMAAVGHIDSAARSLFDAVSGAQRAALGAVRAGATSADVDRAARSWLEGQGLGPAFCHGTGHGLGLDVHEAPRISRAESGHVTTLAPGMVFTIEPGAYLEGTGGVRLEDDVLVTTDGCEVLTTCPRDLVVVSPL
jgi:Xaa-Pro aminopeptidase